MVSKTQKNTQKTKGQAMAEFALTIPVFLLLVFGIIELSRFFLVYSSVFTAVREATRYGSSVGDPASPNYQNCEMIAETAVRMGNFGGVQTDDVIVYFESEPGVWVADCDPGDDPEDRYQPVLGDRVVVEVDTDYDSLIGIVPDLTVNAKNGRTIMLGVQGQVAVITTEEPEGESTPEPTEDTTTPEPTEDTTTPEPTEDTTTPEPTEDTTTPEPTEDTSTPEPTEEITCPTGNIVFTGNTEINNGQNTITLYLKNQTGFDYEIINFDHINWTRYYKKNKNQTYDRKLNGLLIDNADILTISYEPPTGKIMPDQNEGFIDDSENSLIITFKFTDKLDNIGLSFTLNFTKLDGTCPKTLNFSGN